VQGPLNRSIIFKNVHVCASHVFLLKKKRRAL
jgi:hypothetical protein